MIQNSLSASFLRVIHCITRALIAHILFVDEQIATFTQDMDDITAALAEDEKFLLELDKRCDTRTRNGKR